MGWNNWYSFGCDVNETIVRQTADTLIVTGMAAAGYRYVNIDGCWQAGRDSTGAIVPDSSRFPSGIRPLVDYLHARGLKLGIYTDAGSATCASRPMVFSICNLVVSLPNPWGIDSPWAWGPSTAHLWRTTGDRRDTWCGLLDVLD